MAERNDLPASAASSTAVTQGRWSWRADSGQFETSSRTRRLLGAASDEELARLFASAAGKTYKTRPQESFSTTTLELIAPITCGEQFEFDLDTSDADGRSHRVRIAGSGELDSSGALIGAAGTAKDVAQLVAARASDERYGFLVTEAAREAVWDWDLVSGAVFWNDRMLEIVGYSREEFDALEGAHMLFHPDDVPAMNAAKERHYSGEDPLYEVEHRVLRKSGAAVTVLTRGRAFTDSDGLPVRMVGVVRDLDAERAERDAQEHYQFVIDATGAGVSDWEPTSGTLYWNGPLRAMLDLDPHAPASIGWLLTRVHPEDAARVHELLAEPPAIFEEEIRVRLGNGTSRYLLCTGRTQRDDAGRIGRVSVVAQDVTALRRMQRDRVRLVRDLHDSVAQELSAAIFHAEEASQADVTPDQRQELLGDLAARLRRGNEHMRMLIRTLRAVDGGPSPSLEEVLTQLVSMFEERIGVPVQLDVEELELSFAEIQAAFAVTREALNNVSQHAGASEVSVTVRPTRSGYELVVADDGRGFSLTEDVERRFGLAGMRERASEVGGRIEVSSRPGSGTRIILHFTGDGPS